MEISLVTTRILDFFAESDEPCFVVGAVAMSGLGVGRHTDDVDFLARKTFSGSVVGFVEKLGYETLHRSAGYSNHLHVDPEMGRIDFIYSDDATIEQIASRSMEVEIGSLRVRVPAPEHLAAMKVVAMKNDPRRTWKDLRDLQLLMSMDGVDLEEIERQFMKHGLMERYDEIRETI